MLRVMAMTISSAYNISLWTDWPIWKPGVAGSKRMAVARGSRVHLKSHVVLVLG